MRVKRDWRAFAMVSRRRNPSENGWWSDHLLLQPSTTLCRHRDISREKENERERRTDTESYSSDYSLASLFSNAICKRYYTPLTRLLFHQCGFTLPGRMSEILIMTYTWCFGIGLQAFSLCIIKWPTLLHPPSSRPPSSPSRQPLPVQLQLSNQPPISL